MVFAPSLTLPAAASARSNEGLQRVHALYRAHAPALFRVLRRLAVQPDDAADLLQDVFVVALRRAPALLAAGSPRAWLFGVALKVASDSRRRARFRRFLGLDGAAEVASDVTPAHTLEQAQTVERVHRALSRLPPTKREVLVLFELEALSGHEVAEVMGCPVATVWTRLHHARRALERELAADATREAP